jgi:hypothetical protein
MAEIIFICTPTLAASKCCSFSDPLPDQGEGQGEGFSFRDRYLLSH